MSGPHLPSRFVYLIPVFPFLAIMSGYILSCYREKKAIFTVLTVFIIVSLGFNGYHIIRDFRKIRPLGIVSGLEERESFLNRMIHSYSMFQHVNNHLPGNTKLFFIYMKNLGYLCDRPYYSDSMFESYTIEKILARSATPEEVSLALSKRGFTHILYDINYVTGKFSTFSDQAKTLFLLFQEKHLELIKIEKRRYYLYKIQSLTYE